MNLRGELSGQEGGGLGGEPWRQVEEGTRERKLPRSRSGEPGVLYGWSADVRRETAVCRDRKGHEFKDFYKLWL